MRMNASQPTRRRLADVLHAQVELSDEVKAARKRRWIEENWEAIQSHNEWVAKNGLPLAKYRQF